MWWRYHSEARTQHDQVAELWEHLAKVADSEKVAQQRRLNAATVRSARWAYDRRS